MGLRVKEKGEGRGVAKAVGRGMGAEATRKGSTTGVSPRWLASRADLGVPNREMGHV